MTCPACGFEGACRETDSSDADAGYRFHACPHCESAFAEPRRAAPGEWYSANDEFYGWRWEFDRFLSDVERLVPAGASVIEVGCGEGLLLAKLVGRYEALGIELNADAARAARGHGLRVFEGTLGGVLASHPTAGVAALASFHVLEHLERPLDFLHDAMEALAPDGHLFLSVPNPDRLSLRWGREEWDRAPHHLTRFSKGGIARLLARAGFEIADLADQPIEPELAYRLRVDLYRDLPLPKRVREALKLSALLLLRPSARRAMRGKTGQAYYIVARRAGPHPAVRQTPTIRSGVSEAPGPA